MPHHIDAALETALSREAVDRFPDAAAFAAALDASQATAPGHAPWKARGVAQSTSRKLAASIAIALGLGGAAWAIASRPNTALGMPSVRVQRFTTAAGDTTSTYLAATLQQDVVAALAGSGAARVFAMDSARLPSGFAVSGRAARLSDSVEIMLTVLRDPDGEVLGTRTVRQPIGRMQELPELATDAVLQLVGRPRSRAATVASDRKSVV